MSFELKILGSNSAIPAYGRNHTAQVLTIQNQQYLIDCGEATQIQMARNKVKFRHINNIFISHLHGDHYLGLMGLISSMHLLGRTQQLNLFGPVGLSEIISLQLKYSATILNYKINLIELQSDQFYKIHEDKLIEVFNIPLMHRIACSGFLFLEKPKPIRINKEKLPEKLSIQNIARLKSGRDVLDEKGRILFKNEELTLPPRKSRSYAYFSDTLYHESLIRYIKNVDLLYHEATFLDEGEKWATKTYHSTTKQAAVLAKKAKVGKLILGHFSARYKDLAPFLKEAKEVFQNCELAIEGQIFTVDDEQK